jgi:hypothetical protein
MEGGPPNGLYPQIKVNTNDFSGKTFKWNRTIALHSQSVEKLASL